MIVSTNTTDIADSASDVLRQHVEDRKGPSDKTVIVFEYTYDESTVKEKRRTYYTFVALWIEGQGKWYCTGLGGAVPREPTHEELMKVLASWRVKRASVAIEFDQFKP